jgi:hypothetical protein
MKTDICQQENAGFKAKTDLNKKGIKVISPYT